jgi:hypothetical protein
MFYCVWAFCHTTDINTILQFIPNPPLNTPEHGTDTFDTNKSGSALTRSTPRSPDLHWHVRHQEVRICTDTFDTKKSGSALTHSTPRSPDLTPCDIFPVGIYQRQSFVPPLHVSVDDLKRRITTAVASTDEDMLRCVWNELDYRVDICRVTKVSHLKRL